MKLGTPAVECLKDHLCIIGLTKHYRDYLEVLENCCCHCFCACYWAWAFLVADPLIENFREVPDRLKCRWVPYSDAAQ